MFERFGEMSSCREINELAENGAGERHPGRLC